LACDGVFHPALGDIDRLPQGLRHDSRSRRKKPRAD
jgi:hypothetical protein